MTEKKILPTIEKAEVKNEPRKSKRLISFKEYFISKGNVRSETKAAIKVKLNGDLYKSQEEWDAILAAELNKEK